MMHCVCEIVCNNESSHVVQCFPVMLYMECLCCDSCSRRAAGGEGTARRGALGENGGLEKRIVR